MNSRIDVGRFASKVLRNKESLSTNQVNGIVFAVIHYNRPSCIQKLFNSIESEARDGDCILLIDNGSSPAVQEEVAELLEDLSPNHANHVCKFYAKTSVNRGGISGYEYLYELLLSDIFPEASHFIILGDDDFFGPGWRNQVQKYLSPNDWVAWGFHYYHWDTGLIEKIAEHSGDICIDSGYEAHSNWLRRVSREEKFFDRQEHPSAIAISLRSFRLAAQSFATLTPLPYADVGLALVMAFAEKYVYIYSPLSLIGRGCNYGMGDSVTMAVNHPTRYTIGGLPSHSKYAAATYCECLVILDRLDMVAPCTLGLLRSHLISCYGKSIPEAIDRILKSSPNLLLIKWRLIYQDIILLFVVMISGVAPKLTRRMILWSFGYTNAMSLKSLAEIRNESISMLASN